jgi:alpha-tubulin suppressor-like RCC1 family protein
MRRLTRTVIAAALVSAAGAGPAHAARPTATAISSSYDHSCALLSDGTVKCWGANRKGQLGTGDRRRRLTAVHVRGLTDAKAISTAASISCAVLSGGTVECWGDNRWGQLGDGTKTTRTTPVAVSGLTDAVAVSGGGADGPGGAGACALLADHTVKCWGGNGTGGLGNGTRTDSLTPVAVSGLADATAISFEDSHGCALLTGGTVTCWGWGGTLGTTPESRAADQLTPVAVPGVSGAVAIDASAHLDCAVLDRGVVECWSRVITPAVVPGLTNVRDYRWSIDGVVAQHGCALLGNGTVKCHSPGGGSWGQLGNGTKTKSRQPVTVSGIHDATMISTASFDTCALRSGGSVMCWGDNIAGQLGDGTTTDRLRPVAVRGLA